MSTTLKIGAQSSRVFTYDTRMNDFAEIFSLKVMAPGLLGSPLFLPLGCEMLMNVFRETPQAR